MGVFARLWSPAVWTHAAGDPDGFGTGGQSVSRPLMRRPAFKLSSGVAAPFKFLILLLQALCAHPPG
jgi:hypothetical protein